MGYPVTVMDQKNAANLTRIANALERIATVFEKLYEDSSDAKASIKDEFKEDEL